MSTRISRNSGKTIPMYRTLLRIIPLIILSACITPPPEHDSALLSKVELEFVSTIRRGKDLSRSGRVDLAEAEFRRALQMNDKLHSIYNDLGFVLLAQDRSEEAEQMFLKCLRLEPLNIIARENLARLYYNQGKFSRAVTQYEVLIDVFHRVAKTRIEKAIAQTISVTELLAVYRNLATVYYVSGQYDEAICYSNTIQTLARSESNVGQHGRLLLSLDKTDDALRLLREMIIIMQGQVSAKMLLDYAIALYLAKDYNLARASVSRLLAEGSSVLKDRRTARLLKLLIAIDEDNAEEGELTREALFEEEKRFCEVEELDYDHYWPTDFFNAVEGLSERLCENGDESLFSEQSSS